MSFMLYVTLRIDLSSTLGLLIGDTLNVQALSVSAGYLRMEEISP